jgi:ethanolamine utilization microcompartment shell protein EutS
MSKFIQPVSMRVTREQYERDLREPLLAMGYEEINVNSFIYCPIICTNYGNISDRLSNTEEGIKEHFNRHFIPEYNPEYFLAVAAMTNEELGIVGEWWKCVVNYSERFTANKLYKCERFCGDTPDFIDDQGDLNGYYGRELHLLNFKKATLSDLIYHFDPRINNTSTMIELTQQEKDTLVKLITKDNEAIFEKIGVKRDKNPIGVLQNDSHAKEEISKYIIAAEVTPSIIGKKELISRAFVMCPHYGEFYKFVLHEKGGLQVLAIEEK